MELSQEQISGMIYDAARELFENAADIYISDTYPDTVVLCVYPKPTALDEYPPSEHYRMGYTVDNEAGTVALTGTPERVKSERTWVSFADPRMQLIGQFADLDKYEFVAKPGANAVKNVPVFRLGFAQGFNYDAAWAARCLENFKAFKGQGYLPTVIFGHNKPDVEQPTQGHVDNLRIDDDVLFADFVEINDEAFAEIQAGKRPYRSVEVLDTGAKLSAVALLSSMPYYKFPALKSFSGEGGAQFMWSPGEEKRIMRGVHFSAGAGGGSAPAPVTPKPAAAPVQTTNPTPAETVDAVKFGEVEAELGRQRARNDRMAAELRQSRLAGFYSRMNALGIAPAVRDSVVVKHFAEMFSAEDSVVKFSETDEVPGLSGFDRLVTVFAEAAQKGALLAPKPGQLSTTGQAQHPDDAAAASASLELTDAERRMFGENVNPDSLLQYRLTNRLATARKVSFAEASASIMRGEIDEAGIAALETAAK